MGNVRFEKVYIVRLPTLPPATGTARQWAEDALGISIGWAGCIACFWLLFG